MFVLREAMHTGLVLPPAAGTTDYVEFGFGVDARVEEPVERARFDAQHGL